MTFRLGGQVPFIDTSAYVLAGIRRVETDFSRSYAGCLVSAGICQPGEFETGNEFFDDHFNAFSLGAGVEQQLDRVAIRGELRYIVHGSSAQLVLFDDLGVRVPTGWRPARSVWA